MNVRTVRPARHPLVDSRVGRLICVLALLVAALVAHPQPAAAKDVWTTPFDGVKQLHRTSSSPKWSIHALVIDTTTAGITLDATASSQRKQKTSSFAKAVKAQMAINGDFFSYATYATKGLAAGAGKAWIDTADNKADANLTFAKGTPANPAITDPKPIITFDPATMRGVVSGHPVLLDAGVVTAAATNPKSSFCQTRHPRTMVGLDQTGTKLILAVVDGRQPSLSVGMKCAEEADLMKSLGAYRALNLDGGGSSAMYVAGQGVVNSPSDGNERIVGNHLAVFANKVAINGSISGKVYVTGKPTQVLAGASVKVTGGASDVSDAKGLYELSAAPATYTLTCTLSGYVTQSVKVTVAKGQNLKQDFALVVSPKPTDIDGDGVVDTKDNCIKITNASQADKDKDGLGDACDGDDDNDNVFDEDDNCPLVANADQKDTDKDDKGDVCDTDDDDDGVLDTKDNCALVDNVDQKDTDKDAKGDACDTDDDNDKVLDVKDNCPLKANANQADKDKDGYGDVCDPVDDTPPPPADPGPDAGSTDAGGNDAGSTDVGSGNDAGPKDVIADSTTDAGPPPPPPPPPQPDYDKDGLADKIDNCPYVANADQTDLDGDQQGDTCDPDDDNDGESDKVDNCSKVYNPNQEDADKDGKGDACDTTPQAVDAGGTGADSAAAQADDADAESTGESDVAGADAVDGDAPDGAAGGPGDMPGSGEMPSDVKALDDTTPAIDVGGGDAASGGVATAVPAGVDSGCSAGRTSGQAVWCLVVVAAMVRWRRRRSDCSAS